MLARHEHRRAVAALDEVEAAIGSALASLLDSVAVTTKCCADEQFEVLT